MHSKLIILFRVLFAFLLIKLNGLVLAANLGSSDVELSTPIGRDILPGGGIIDTDIHTSFVFSKLIPFVIRYGLGLAVVMAVMALIIGGYQFIIAFGNQEKRQAAQKTVTYALIGLIVAIAAFAIVTVITQFTFSPVE